MNLQCPHWNGFITMVFLFPVCLYLQTQLSSVLTTVYTGKIDSSLRIFKPMKLGRSLYELFHDGYVTLLNENAMHIVEFLVLVWKTETCGQYLVNIPIKFNYGKLRVAKKTFYKSHPTVNITNKKNWIFKFWKYSIHN